MFCFQLQLVHLLDIYTIFAVDEVKFNPDKKKTVSCLLKFLLIFRLKGYFEHDKFVGTEMNKTLKKEMAKKKNVESKSKPANKIVIDGGDGL